MNVDFEFLWIKFVFLNHWYMYTKLVLKSERWKYVFNMYYWIICLLIYSDKNML